MSKIICDICGTSYPDTAQVCPICGFPRGDAGAIPEVETADAVASAAVSHTKGGRFSNKNVKKRNSGEETAARRTKAPEDKPARKGSPVLVVLLAIAVLVVGIYIGWRFWQGRNAYADASNPPIGMNPSTDSTESTPAASTLPAETGVKCVGLTVSDAAVQFLGAGRGWKLSVSPTPADTTQEILFTTSDENVVTVTQDGVLTSVGPGSAVITITCGDVVQECQVICDFGDETEPTETAPETTVPETTPPETTKPTEPEETTKPTEPPKPTDPPAPSKGFKLDRSDVTLFSKGESFTFTMSYNGGNVNRNDVEWKSSDPSVATVEGGKVTAVSGGRATITAAYKGESQECIIRCRIEEVPETTPPATEKPAVWSISASDVTVVVDESFRLRLRDEDGDEADVTWKADKSGIVKIEGNRITGLAVGTAEVSCTKDGKTYTCIVRVVIEH